MNSQLFCKVPERSQLMKDRDATFLWTRLVLLCAFAIFTAGVLHAQAAADPGVITPTPAASPCGAGQPNPLPGLTTGEVNFFCAALARFETVDSVSGVVTPGTNGQCTPVDQGHNASGSTIPCSETGVGLGPRFNGNSCAQCHAFPVVLAASPVTNPEVALATLDGATNTVPSFLSKEGPIREVRFIDVPGTTTPDGNVHNLFTIKGRVDASNAMNINGNITTCSLVQPDFSQTSNLIFRIPLQTLGDGLVELIGDDNLENNHEMLTPSMGVSGFFNVSGNDATFTRFGWKAQNKSLLIFSAEAYNVEQGVTNEGFPNHREIDNELLNEDINACLFTPLPEDTTNIERPTPNSASAPSDFSSDVVNFTTAMRFSAPPARQNARFSAASLSNGQAVFDRIGCNLCHSDNSTGQLVTVAKTTHPSHQGGQAVLAFSDFAVHDMGVKLQDQVTQGLADGRHFRSAPLWGLGSRIFLLHDGRTQGLVAAIEDHQSDGSEANTVINNFLLLSSTDQQDLLNFLRSL
jgi:CxxC motif-containing protein (DUF1111 family)